MDKDKHYRKYIIDAEFLNNFLSKYHQHGIKHDHMGLPWSERWEFIYHELKIATKRKMYGKIKLYEDKDEQKTRNTKNQRIQ